MTLLVSGSDVGIIEGRLLNELFPLDKWLGDNKLSIHLGKTECVLFGRKSKPLVNSEMKIPCSEMHGTTVLCDVWRVDLD